ncbi:protein kinase 3-like [Pecten maximus]|uniref:protein kinase 3-like n=1 Tax=Pecten maximus TaxID=6579 RepID=UPI0014586773|nr:protein kinase 3-like [Pecten maximus]
MITGQENMEDITSSSESGNYSSQDLRSSGVKMVPRSRAHSAPTRKILQPGKDHAEDRLSCSSPVIQYSEPIIVGLEQLTRIDIHINRNISSAANNSQFNKVLPPVQDDFKSNSVFIDKISNKVFDTGKSYSHSADGYLANNAETMPALDQLKESDLPLPSLPFEIIDNSDGRQVEDEEGMEVDVDHERLEQGTSEESEQVTAKVPVTKFRPGFTVYGTKDALVDMVLQMINLPDEETGIFVDKSLWFLSSEDRREVIRKKVLGRGTFGKVNLYVHDETDYVVKQITSDFQRNEIVLTAKLNSPYIIQCYGMVVRNKIPEIIMEYGGQSMLQMARLRKFQDRDIWDLTYQGLCGLEYLEECQICHHDIKPENLLLMVDENQFLLKIADFGAAKMIGEKNDMVGWTVEYLSPERAWMVLLSKFPHQLKPTGQEESDLTGKVDIFAMALTMMYAYEKSHVLIKYATNGDNIYRDAEKQSEFQVNLLVDLCSNLDLALSLMPKSVSTDMRFVLNKMLQGDVNKRCNATEGKNWMNFLSNLAIQQRDKGLKIQALDKSTEVCTAQTLTKPSVKPTTTATRKCTPHVGKPSPPAGTTAQQPTGEEKGWVKDCKTATMESMANLPSGLKTRMVKRKLLNKLSTCKKIKTDHPRKEQDRESIDTNGVSSPGGAVRAESPDVIVIDDDTEEDQQKEIPESEGQDSEAGNGNIPNFLLDMNF